MDADDVIYIIADGKRSKTDVNLENSTKALNDGDVSYLHRVKARYNSMFL